MAVIVAVPTPVKVTNDPDTVAMLGSDEVYVKVPAAFDVGGVIVCGASPSTAVTVGNADSVGLS